MVSPIGEERGPDNEGYESRPEWSGQVEWRNWNVLIFPSSLF